ncbi:p4 [Tomato infectious chlorosis virus]|uniref:p4 n=1 Tax=Tomato infectious chlorosis virus TaxID=52135 RepID=C0K277_9CLOS|nr:p4 [Tomato infectious chlorosis virus]ACN87736.1 p4 [Tomato infectious chlorosis virus]ACN87744.1 p4 [Tomato infectious chlorosis virus]ACS73874.1 p4 [Tomato infectious chlorosis virus]WRK24206.1 4 kDa protein [Tomato infectious chlorosis virus]BBF90597.1 p4 protein [Tomato infectious chlorosis virus]
MAVVFYLLCLFIIIILFTCRISIKNIHSVQHRF